MNVEGSVLYLVLASENREEALECYGKLKSQYFAGTSVLPIYKNIRRFYDTNGSVPTFKELLFSATARGTAELSQIAALESQQHPEVDIHFAVDVLLNAYAQKEALSSINSLLDGIRELPGQEIVEAFSHMALELDGKLDNSEEVFTAKDLRSFKTEDDIAKNYLPVGLSNRMDATGGLMRQGLYLFGGRRGSGKSIVAANISVNARESGLVSPFFTIEMSAQETDDRMMAMRAGVSYQSLIGKGEPLSNEDNLRVAAAKAEDFEGGTDLLDSWPDKDKFKGIEFEDALLKLPERQDIGKIVIIDNKELTLTAIDSQLAKLSAEYGDRLGPVVVDYVNQVVYDTSDPNSMYDWKTQIHLAKQLKVLARKYNIPMVSPYQTDAEGEARLSKGLLDAVDGAWAIKREPDSDVMELVCQKLRGAEEFDMRIRMSTKTLVVDPTEVKVESDGDGEGGDVEDMTSATNNSGENAKELV